MSKPKRNIHEPKTEQAQNFKGSYAASTRVDPRQRVGNADREPWPRADLTEAVRLTGQWRNHSELYHIFINHAGPHIELLIALIESGTAGKTTDKPRDKHRSETRLFAFGGDVDASDRSIYHLYLHDHVNRPIDDKSLRCGRLRLLRSGTEIQLDLDLRGYPGPLVEKLQRFAKTTSKRIGDRPNYLQGYLNADWVDEGFRTALWFPPTPYQIKHMSRHLFEVEIELDSEDYLPNADSPNSRSYRYVELVQRHNEITVLKKSWQLVIPKDHRQWLTNIANALDTLVQRAQSKSQQITAADGGIDAMQVDYWRHATLSALLNTYIKTDGNTSRSLLTLTQGILDDAKHASLLEFEKLLLLTPNKPGAHEYEAELELLPVDELLDDVGKLSKILKPAIKRALEGSKRLRRRLPFGLLAGTLVVRKRGQGAFVGTYPLTITGFKLAASVGAGTSVIKSKGVARNVSGVAWRPEHIPGRVVFTEIGASGSAGASGKGVSFTLMSCHGGGAGKPGGALGFNLSGMSDVMTAGAGGGAAAMYYHGFIFDGDWSGGDIDVTVPESVDEFKYGTHTAVGPLHFPINGAGLTPEACELLEIFACCELPVLSHKGLTLEVDGYADQPDADFSNKILSRNRAISVYNYLKNILEDDLATLDLNEIPDESVERDEAKKPIYKGDPYIIDDPSLKDGSVTIVGHGAPPRGNAGKKKAQYDPELRRVDLRVNGEASLSLRRTKDK